MNSVRIDDKFWNEYISLVNDVVLPYQWEILNDNVPNAEPSRAIRNFKIAAGLEEGEFYGCVFQDSDLAKWIEAVSYSLKITPNESLMEKADEAIEYISKAQQPDGYLNTYYILNKDEKRFSNLTDCHELYCLGHMIEGAVAYYDATGKRKLLDVVCRYADLVDSLFGSEEGKIKGYPGHQEIELALVRLYEVTQKEKYLKLAKFFIDERGKEPNFFTDEWEKRGKKRHWGGNDTPELKYHQAHKPVREQTEAVGHAVRAVYMYTSMAHIARKTNDKELFDTCSTLWKNITEKQMYITGGIGQTSIGEAFTFDYDLPNDTVYSETCAAIGLVFFARQMLETEQKSCYADVIERVLYNTVLAGMAKDGKHFLYVNPLEVWPEASEKAPIRHHVKAERPGWFFCACCPPNLARLLLSLSKYIYTVKENEIFVNLYIGNEAKFELEGTKAVLHLESDYPNDGIVKLQVSGEGKFTVALRIPGWCNNPSVLVNGGKVDSEEKNGYLHINRQWSENDIIDIDFPMESQIMQANTKVRANAGKVALMRGPVVYCAEEADNGKNLAGYMIYKDLKEEYAEGFPSNAVIIKASGEKDGSAREDLYYPYQPSRRPAEVTFIPYYLWGNRGKGEMLVWMRFEK